MLEPHLITRLRGNFHLKNLSKLKFDIMMGKLTG